MADKKYLIEIDIKNDEMIKARRKIGVLQNEIKKLKVATEKNIPAQKASAVTFARLETQLKATRGRYNELQKEALRANGVMKQQTSFGDRLQKSFGSVATKIAGIGIAITAGIGMLKKFGEGLMQVNQIADKFDQMMQAGKNASVVFFDALATGEWSGFLTNMRKAIDLGVEYAKTMDWVGDSLRAYAWREAEARAETAQLMNVVRDRDADIQDRIRARDRILQIEEELAIERGKIYEKQFKAEVEQTAGLKGIREEALIAYFKNYERTNQAYEKTFKDIIAFESKLKDSAWYVDLLSGGASEVEKKAKVTTELLKNYSKEKVEVYNFWKQVESIDDESRDRLINSAKELAGVKKEQAERTSVLIRLNAQLNKIIEEGEETGEEFSKTVEKTVKKSIEIAVEWDTTDGEGEWGDIVLPEDQKYEEVARTQAEKFFETWQKEFNDKQTQANVKSLDKEEQMQQDSLDKKLKNIDIATEAALTAESLISNAMQYRMNQELEMAGENAKKREEIEKKYAKKQQALAVAMATINTALAITKVFAVEGPFGFLQAGILSAKLAAEIFAIKAQKFATGGKVGESNIQKQRNGDSVLATLMPGEVVLTERQQALLGGSDTFRKIGVPGFANGGVVGSPMQSMNDPIIALINRIDDLQVVQDLSGLEKAQNKYIKQKNAGRY